MKPNKKKRWKTYLSVNIFLAYLSLNVGFAAGSVLCIQTDGDVLFKFRSCQVYCSSCPDHSTEFLSGSVGISEEFQTEDSCCPCSDIPVSKYISQYHSRAPEDVEYSHISATSASGLVFTPETAAGVFGGPQISVHMNQIFSLLKATVILN